MRYSLLLAAGLVLATSAPATAGKSKKDAALDALKADLPTRWSWLRMKTWSEGESGLDRYLAQPSCMGLVNAAKQAGATDADTIEGYFEYYPAAVKVAQNKYTITLADAAELCGQWDARIASEPVAIYVRRAAAYKKSNPNEPTAQSVASYSRGAGDATVKKGQQCLDAIAARQAAGASDKITLDDGKQVTLDDGKALCQYQVDHGHAFNDRIKEVQDAKRAEIAAKYEALGVKGQRLELFIEYDGVSFRGKKCEIIDDINVLVKAKYVYQWLENADYTHTIRKYTFKGDAYKVSEKTYKTEAKAYKGCK